MGFKLFLEDLLQKLGTNLYQEKGLTYPGIFTSKEISLIKALLHTLSTSQRKDFS